MKEINSNRLKSLLSLCFVLCMSLTKAQRTSLYCEDFDSSGSNTSAISLQVVPSNATVGFWADSVIKKGPSGYSVTDTAGNRTSSYMIMPKIRVNNYDSIFFRFDQICYLDWFDEGVVQYTFDGINWIKFPREILHNGISERVYYGGSIYQLPQRSFSKLSNPTIWHFLDSLYSWTPVNSQNAWVTEIFDASPIIREKIRITGFRPDSIQIRLGLLDNPASTPGRSGTHQWWIDNICVEGANAVVGLNELDQQLLGISPNPVQDIMQIQLENFDPSMEYRIISINGKIIQEGRLEKTQINLEILPMGLYFLEINSSAGNHVKKFLKQ